MYNFVNDYNNICHPEIFTYLNQFKDELLAGYGCDYHSQNAKKIIQSICCSQDIDVHFLIGGTITNKVLIAHTLKSYEAVICTKFGHINVHETGAIEALGHKVLTVPTDDGKIKIADLEKVLNEHQGEHMVKPKLVYISNATEVGTVYYLDELEELSSFCRKNDLYLFVDGARLGVALCSYLNDVTLKDLARLCDAFTIGGTKNGLIMGEALVVVNNDIKKDMRYTIKQLGAMYAKGFIVGMQYERLFTDNLFYEIAEIANDNASLLRMGLAELKIKEKYPNFTNQIFISLTSQAVEQLAKIALFEVWENLGDEVIIRLVTTHQTNPEEISNFLIELSNIVEVCYE